MLLVLLRYQQRQHCQNASQLFEEEKYNQNMLYFLEITNLFLKKFTALFRSENSSRNNVFFFSALGLLDSVKFSKTIVLDNRVAYFSVAGNLLSV